MHFLRRSVWGTGLCFALWLAPRVATADDAQSLFDEGNKLVAAGDFAAACPKLAESLRLEPAVGTQFNLANCYEHLGRIATAYALYTDVVRIAHAAGKFPREEAAKKAAAAIEPRVPHVHIAATDAAPGLEVAIDDKAIGRDAWSDLPLDPGAHRVRATAPNHEPWESSFDLPEGKPYDLAVPALVDLTPAPPPVSIAPPPPEPPKPNNRKLLVPIAGGGALAAIATGAIAGAVALSSKGKADDVCPKATYNFHCPTQAGADEWSSAKTAGNVSTVAFVIGGVALAATVVLWLTNPSAPAPRASLNHFSF
jgi:hypothetical protein